MLSTLEAAKSSWEDIVRTAVNLSATMSTDTWVQRSTYPLFTEEWDKVLMDRYRHTLQRK